MDKVVHIVSTILESQIFWGCVGLVLAAVAFTGKLSVNASNAVLLMAWVVGCFGIYKSGVFNDWYQLVAIWLFTGSMLALIGSWLQPSLPIISPIPNLPANARGDLRSFTNAQLRERTAIVAKRLRQMENEHRGKSDRVRQIYFGLTMRAKSDEERAEHRLRQQDEYIRLQREKEMQFQNELRPEAFNLKVELLRRVVSPPEVPLRSQVSLDGHSLVGPSPLNDAADYLEALANSLPQ